MNKRISLITIGLFFSVLLFLPFSRLSELPILLLSILGINAFFNKKIDFQTDKFKLLTIIFLCYLSMIFISSLDSYWQEKTLIVGLASLRFYLASCALLAYINPQHFKLLGQLFALFTIFLAVDALFQYFIGFNLIGRESYPGRLNGMFGQHHAKLGPVLALLFPIVLISLEKTQTLVRWLAVFIIIISVILSGTRSAWIMLLFSIVAYFFYHVKQKRFKLILKSLVASSVIIITLWFISPEFQQRLNRSLALFHGSEASIDFALANRLPIWKTSINMIQEHPFNGVGAHAFRKAYPEFAESNDSWQQQGGVGMHAHHWLLEVLSETGIIGFLIFLFASLKLFQFIKKDLKSGYVWAFSIALVSAFLPIVSTYSMFASFWSICLWLIGSSLILMRENND